MVNVGKPKRFLRRLFQAARGNHQEEVAEGHLCRFPQLRHFPQPFAPADLFGSRMRSLIFVMGNIRRKFETEFKRQLIAQIEAGQTTIGQARGIIRYPKASSKDGAFITTMQVFI